MKTRLWWLLLLGGCITDIPVDQMGNITCYHNDLVVFTGNLVLTGDGLSPLEELFDGEWSLCRLDSNVVCVVDLRDER